MQCMQCFTQTNNGELFKFYYGKRGATSVIDRRTTFTRYTIRGTEEPFLCKRCVDQAIEGRARLFGGGVFIVILLLSFLRLAMGPAPAGSEMETVIGFPTAIIAGLILYLGIRRWKKNKMRKFAGDTLAIKLRKTMLKQGGNDAFFTREAYSRLS
jgi:hypothetical protein